MSTRTKEFSPDKFQITYPVEPKFHGIRLDHFMGNYLKSFSREQIKKKIHLNEIYIEERTTRPHRPNTKVHHGEHVTMISLQSNEEKESFRGEDIEFDTNIEILFEDEDFIVISKPPFMVTHPTGRHVFNCVTTNLEAKYGHVFHSVHRIDRETSGILILGKNSTASNEITHSFFLNKVKKCYFFIANNLNQTNFEQLNKNFFIADENLFQTQSLSEERLFVKAYPKGSPKGKVAKTTFKLLHHSKDLKYLLALAFPETGRQHQIRAHAYHHGIPLLGDKIYTFDFDLFNRYKEKQCSDADFDYLAIPRQALHAYKLSMEFKGKTFHFKAPIPKDLSTWCLDHLNVNPNDLDLN